MALPTSGPISLNEIHIEAGGTSGTTASINDADIRTLIGKASGTTMSFSEWYGASGSVVINLTIAANTNNYNIQSSRGGTYVAGATTVNVTINSGVTVGSTSTGTYALETGSGWASGDVINITNNGTVKGRGGDGGHGEGIEQYGTFLDDGTDGGAGGNAFRAQFATTFTNNGSVYGGGGGGGGGGATSVPLGFKGSNYAYVSGGGGGGGAGVNGGTGGDGAKNRYEADYADDGSNGTATAGGAGGAAYIVSFGTTTGTGGTGGNGGGLGSAGSDGVDATGGNGFANAHAGGARGNYQVGASFINSGSGIGGVVGGGSS